MTKLRRVRVEIDADTPADVFWAWTDPSVLWNGFTTPSFDRGEAEKVVAWSRRFEDPDDTSRLTWDGDVLLETVEEWVTRYEPDALGRYGIGSFSWTWQTLPDDAPEDEAALAEWLRRRSLHTRTYCTAHNAALKAAYAEGKSPREALEVATAAGTKAVEEL